MQQVLGSGWVTSGPQVIEVEREFAEHVGARRAIAVSGSVAIFGGTANPTWVAGWKDMTTYPVAPNYLGWA